SARSSAGSASSSASTATGRTRRRRSSCRRSTPRRSAASSSARAAFARSGMPRRLRERWRPSATPRSERRTSSRRCAKRCAPTARWGRSARRSAPSGECTTRCARARSLRGRFGALALVAAAFVVSRAIIAALGVRFDISLVPWLWQLLDLQLLQHRLAESLWHLHSQPPLFNLAVGAELKVVPNHVAGTFHLLFLLLGLTAAPSA